jgi:phosphatidylinositol alpha-1,6-mannosyltransferase
VFLLSALLHTIFNAFTWRPEKIIAGSGLTAPIVFLAARLCKAQAIAYVHGLDLAVDNTLYRWLWLPFIRRLDGVIANSHATAKLAEQIGLDPNRIQIVHPGVHLPTLDPAARSRYRMTQGFGDRPLLLTVGRLTKRKGLLEFIQYAFPLIVKNHPDCLLLVVGDIPKHALHANNITQHDILALAQNMGVDAHLHFLASPSDAELSDIFQSVDVHVFPIKTLPNDPEGFGMVAIEAAAHGLPTVAFASGGVVDAVAEGISGKLITAGDYRGFAETVMQYINKPTLTQNSEHCRRFATQFDWLHFEETLYSATQELVHVN